MNCEGIDAEGLVRSYLAGHLGETESVALEEHVIRCDRCFEELELGRLIRAGFREREEAATPPKTARHHQSRVAFFVAGLALAATVAGVIILGRGDADYQPDLVGLVTIGPADLPPYVPLTLRNRTDDVSESLFLTGMDAYAHGDYDKASTDLENAVEADSTLLVRRLYLGASMSALARYEDATPHLRAAAQVPALSGDARWLLAKSLLRLGEVESGKRELILLSRARGPRSEAAIDLLERLAGLNPRDTTED